MTARVAERLEAAAWEWPDVAAAALAERGVGGVDRRRWAELHGLAERAVEAVETGGVVAAHRPPRVRGACRPRSDVPLEDDLDDAALVAAVLDAGPAFRTRDLADHPIVRAAHADRVGSGGFASAVGRWLATRQDQLELQRSPPGPDDRGAVWQVE